MILSPRDATCTASAVVLRSLPTRRAGRLRFSWFLLGTIFGVALSFGLSSRVTPRPTMTAAVTPATAKTSLAPALPPQSVAVPATALLPAPPAASAPPPPINAHAKTSLALPASMNLAVHDGDTLVTMLTKKGVAKDEANQVAQSIGQVYNPARLTVGQEITLKLDQSKEDVRKPSVAGLSLAVSPLKTVSLARVGDDDFRTREIMSPAYKGYSRAGGVIHSSLYQTGMDAGIPPQMLAEIIQAYSYDVDFQRDIQEGDRLDVVFERIHTDHDVTAGYGNVLYASLTLSGKTITLYRHTSPDGYAGYYNARGESVRKALLRTPINGARITSGFGMRMHPLLGYSKMHKGIDFGAPTGTPIYAAGDGVIGFAGRKGGYGNFVIVKHNKTYATGYGHASRIARGIHPGVHVKQGQVIAYVGSTGMSTGPHLHYEIMMNGSQVNPSGIRFRTGQTLAGKEYALFKRQVKGVDAMLASLPVKNQLASLER